jgi:succinate dehydrogenase / fumarate reductase, cytochrome b subunit
VIPPRILFRAYVVPLVGMTAFWIQRVSGVLLLLYLLIHVETVHHVSGGKAAFDGALAAFRNPFFRLLEIGLLGVVILHALNGIRIIIIDCGAKSRHQRTLFWVLAGGMGLLIFVAGALPLFVHSVVRR